MSALAALHTKSIIVTQAVLVVATFAILGSNHTLRTRLDKVEDGQLADEERIAAIRASLRDLEYRQQRTTRELAVLRVALQA